MEKMVKYVNWSRPTKFIATGVRIHLLCVVKVQLPLSDQNFDSRPSTKYSLAWRTFCGLFCEIKNKINWTWFGVEISIKCGLRIKVRGQQTQKLISVHTEPMFLTDFLSMPRHPREISSRKCCSIVAFSQLFPNFGDPLCLLYVSPSFTLGKQIHPFHFRLTFLGLDSIPQFCSIHKDTHTQNSLGEHFREATMHHPPPAAAPTQPPNFPHFPPFSRLSSHFPGADNNNVKQHWGIDKGRLLTSRQPPQDGQNSMPHPLNAQLHLLLQPNSKPILTWHILSYRAGAGARHTAQKSDKIEPKEKEQLPCPQHLNDPLGTQPPPSPPEHAAHAHSARHEWQFFGQQIFMRRPLRTTSKIHQSDRDILVNENHIISH